jgi:peptidoglycan lytic transglycosylase G
MFRKKPKYNQPLYTVKRPYHRGLRRLAVVVTILLCIFVVAAVVVRHEYYMNLRPVSSSNKVQLVTIATGTSTPEIADLLLTDGLIRSSAAFEWYVNSHGAHSDLQAGTYALKPSMSLPEIVDVLSNGKVATNLVTILPGQRIDQVKKALLKAGFNVTAVDAALDAANYSGYTALADKPTSANLEGFLYPDTFQKDADTSPQIIVQESLTEMGQHLTPDIRAAFAREGLSVYQGVTLASMVEQEVSKPSDRAQAAQVFLSRLKRGMPLGSDSTALYGAIKAGVKPSTTFDSPYNTLLHKGLPPGPINNVSDSSLQAVAHPAKTNWLYFVSGDNGKTYFSKTAQEHELQVQQYCHKLCTSAS